MKVIYKKLPSKPKKCVATIGVFDGIHLGHKFILEKVIREAKKRQIFSLAITFDCLPQQFLTLHHARNTWKPRKKFFGYITSLKQKISLMKSLNPDYLWLLKTGRPLLELTSRKFMEYIFKNFEIKMLFVGEDFRFGKSGRGDIKELKTLAKEYGCKLSVLKKKRLYKRKISSSRIRKLINKGEILKAGKNLGRIFSLQGKVKKGKSFGTKLGFPTANIRTFNYVIPAQGVYAAKVILGTSIYLAAVNIGRSPTIKESLWPTVEVHIIGFNRNIMDKIIEVAFLERLRPERIFSSIAELQKAISKDIRFITSKYSISS
ncbi:MAG: riboflavin biosynthesis protein RibF [Candidatus Omnitrophica bacterium]|nr:riboflavin biosynthesis protein RibF [Candidatus Omnitrophota bacterium]MDD5429393.1 riboflavin biosynthesis protein RibF [Candidatus Omnitrophota bacterium]